MKSWLGACIVAVSALLGGCGTVIKSNVTTFHEWPDALADRSYVFERTREQNDSLEYRSYENLVRNELSRLGFVEAPAATKPTLKASFAYQISGARDVREVYPVVVNASPFPYPYPFWHGPAWRGYYGPFYDPFWYGPPVVQHRVSQYQLFTRQLRVSLARMADNKKLFETTVVSDGTNGSLAAVMPYMVRSAFAEFPGPSGVPRVVELRMEQ
ncbi:MAG TPA: DUF4136 domain-containing protein [Noviherbaspirillum sp.]|uniref:DUF4136 domain-containing protein n=1 Tax=Noviherbaspirillum sp. TaxID=1926288 RepID=UPI002D50C97C|nr:DUF4136 domain-containing protein [Noviherbaspirillum sp.]HYD95248.1 DUF4136 domain-containing protein [Noviherbaspirillum sp.]